MVSHIRDYQHIIIDTRGQPDRCDLPDLAQNCDLFVVPAVPESVATDGLTHTLAKLRGLANKRHKVLLTMVPPKPRTEGQQLREMLISEGIPVFKTGIPGWRRSRRPRAEGVPVYGVKDDRNAARAWAAMKLRGRKL